MKPVHAGSKARDQGQHCRFLSKKKEQANKENEQNKNKQKNPQRETITKTIIYMKPGRAARRVHDRGNIADFKSMSKNQQTNKNN